jgi:hypothetical protein
MGNKIHPMAADSGTATDLLECAQEDKKFIKITIAGDET